MVNRVRIRLRVLFIVLAGLAIAQLGWWSYLLISQQKSISKLIHTIDALEREQRFIYMILTEGSFWLLLWTAGLFAVYRTVRQERKLLLAHRDFLSAITHELKTPIANIQLCLESLQRPNVPEHKKSIFIERALSATDKLHLEIQNILKLNQQTSQNEKAKEMFSLLSVVNTCISEIDEEKYPGIKWTIDIPEIVTIESEKEGFSLVLKAILENAAKYSHQIETEPGKEITPAIQLSFSNSCLTIQDNGIGFEDKDHDNLFIEFYRGELAKMFAIPGTGIGLSIAKQIANKLNIGLKIKSPGKFLGCTVSLRF